MFVAVIVAIIALLLAAIPTGSYVSRQIYQENYYVTASGRKYHLENCFFIQGRDARRMTREEFDSGQYEPCKICIRQ